MLRNISHELRSPLTRLRISLELARAKAGSQVSHALDRIESETEKLNDMIGSLLEMSRLKDSWSATTETLKVKEAIKDIIEDAKFEASENGKELVSNIQCNCIIKTHSKLLKSSMENIIRNAIRYAESRIEVEVAQDSGFLRITICDDGKGVGKEHLEDIFSPFYRVDDDRDRKTGGTGLGLAIAKAFSDMNNGSIKAYNKPQGGLCVEILIPMTKSAHKL